MVTVGAEFGKEGIMCAGLDKGKIYAGFFFQKPHAMGPHRLVRASECLDKTCHLGTTVRGK